MRRDVWFLCLLLVQSYVKCQKDISVAEVREYCNHAMDKAKTVTASRLQEELLHSPGTSSSPYNVVTNFLHTHPYAKSLTYSAMSLTTAIDLIHNRYGLSKQRALKMLEDYNLSDMLKPLPGPHYADEELPTTPDIDYCPYPGQIVCTSSTVNVRTFDGSCNNEQMPLIGRAMTPYRRLLSAVYADGMDEMRLSASGNTLPSARLVSSRLLPDVDRPSQSVTMALVFFSQFTDHDLTRTAAYKVSTSDGGQMGDLACGEDGCLQTTDRLNPCWPIAIPDNDMDFATNSCLKFVRSMQVPHLNCRIGAREQLNQVTHWLDGSQIYGSSKEDALAVRDHTNSRRGRMAMSLHPHPRYKAILPKDTSASLCNGKNETIHCFKAGDGRVNENSGITMYHTIFVRQHNMLEEGLHRRNPHWDGERLFQETRKIVVAMLQHITYNELLPQLLGDNILRYYQLDLLKHGYFEGYDATIDARIPNEFAAAAFRYGHTLLQERLIRSQNNDEIDDNLWLSQTFNNPVHIYDTGAGGIDAFIRGLVRESSQSFDWFFTKQVSRCLFTANPPTGIGHDLMSINIQRGRDHGLPSYNDFREWCGLRRATTFLDLSSEITDNAFLEDISSVYSNVDDIDLYVGGVSEMPVTGGIVGPTFACIIGSTFRSLRFGDRLWYENAEAGFTKEQLQELRKVQLSRILCLNGDDVSNIQPYVFLRPTSPDFDESRGEQFNRPVPCASLPDINLNFWEMDH